MTDPTTEAGHVGPGEAVVAAARHLSWVERYGLRVLLAELSLDDEEEGSEAKRSFYAAVALLLADVQAELLAEERRMFADAGRAVARAEVEELGAVFLDPDGRAIDPFANE